MTTRLQKLPMQGREQPSLDLCRISQLMPFTRPNVKCFLRQIAGVRLVPGEAESKSVKIAVIKLHELFKLRIGGHDPSSRDGSLKAGVCSRHSRQTVARLVAGCEFRFQNFLRAREQSRV